MNFRNTIFNYGNDGWYRSYFSFPISYRSHYFLNLSNISGIGGGYHSMDMTNYLSSIIVWSLDPETILQQNKVLQ